MTSSMKPTIITTCVIGAFALGVLTGLVLSKSTAEATVVATHGSLDQCRGDLYQLMESRAVENVETVIMTLASLEELAAGYECR